MSLLFVFACLCLILAGFCVWKLTYIMEKLQAAHEKEQNFRLAEREAAFRREKFLLVMALQNDPQLADAIAKMPANSQEPEMSLVELAGFGEATVSKRRI